MSAFWGQHRRTAMIQWLIVVVMPLLTVACAPPARPCGCSYGYNPIGCYITRPAPEGFKCKCSVHEFIVEETVSNILTVCISEAFPCRNDEACPGGRYSYCACVQGGGNCQGYRIRPSTVESCPKVNKVEASSSLRQYSYKDCECAYYSNPESSGGRIVQPAPEGFKCSCVCNDYGKCGGYSIGCDEDEYCPADDYTYCGCLRGGGNCNGYRHIDRDLDCNLGKTCDCNRSSDWTRGRYSITEVQFNTDNIIRRSANLTEISPVLEIQNNAVLDQKKGWERIKTTTSESSFERTHGLSVDLGIQFFSRIPLTLSAPQSFKYGEKTTTSNQTRLWYECKSPPKTHTRCSFYLMSFDVTVPYTMLLKHNEIPNCTCESFGNWRSTTTSYSQMTVKTLGPCNSIVNGKCE